MMREQLVPYNISREMIGLGAINPIATDFEITNLDNIKESLERFQLGIDKVVDVYGEEYKIRRAFEEFYGMTRIDIEERLVYGPDKFVMRICLMNYDIAYNIMFSKYDDFTEIIKKAMREIDNELYKIFVM